MTSQTALKVIDKEISPKGNTTSEKIKQTLTEELIIAICAPIGSLKEPVIETLSDTLQKDYGYEEPIKIKLSEFIDKYTENKAEVEEGKSPGYTKLMNKIKGGTKLRKEYTPEVLAELAISEIHADRYNQGPEQKVEDFKSRRVCYIIDSLKNTSELELLRSVYSSNFFSFSIFSPLNERIENLKENRNLNPEEVKELVSVDEHENKNDGQNVRDTFVEGDFIVRVSEKNKSQLSEKIKRYLNLIFNSAVVTPFPNEIAMYQAKSAAGNSACLSRQVGATITNTKGEIISRGWNDVPKFGGNLYKEGDKIDQRCLNLGYCSNDKTKNEISKHIIDLLKKDKELHKTIEDKEDLILDRIENIIRRSSKVKDLIEFSRSVHAEMHAIIIGSQLSGNQMIGGKLFCTTYPCHNCARHIIAAGITEVYYIEPYVKSLCIELHSDAITEDEDSKDKVRILVYDGVAPRRFLEFFTMQSERKDTNGRLISKKNMKFGPKSQISLQAIPTLEKQAIHSLTEKGLINEN